MSPLNERQRRAQFIAFRTAFGTTLCLLFASLVPYADELYGADGMVPDPAVNYTRRFLPAIWTGLDGSLPAQAILVVAALACVPLALGWQRRLASLFLWVLFLTLFWRNNFTRHVALDYIGWMLLVCAAVPAGEGGLFWRRIAPPRSQWRFPPLLHAGAWAIAGVGYSLSGWAKLGNPLWRDGSALSFILSGPLARDWIVTRGLVDFSALLEIATWGALGAELLCLPMALWRPTRAVAWVTLTAMHLGIAFLLNLGEIPIVLLLFHGLLFDVRWLPGARRIEGNAGAADPSGSAPPPVGSAGTSMGTE